MLHETLRTYSFIQDGEFYNVNVSNVRILVVSESGGHRLTKANGVLIYIPSGWVCLKIKTKYGWEQ